MAEKLTPERLAYIARVYNYPKPEVFADFTQEQLDDIWERAMKRAAEIRDLAD